MEAALAASPSMTSLSADLTAAAAKVTSMEADMRVAAARIGALESQSLPPVPGDGAAATPGTGDANAHGPLALRVATLEGQVQVLLTTRRRNPGTMRTDERCKSMGLLGITGNTAPLYKSGAVRWSSSARSITPARAWP